MPPGKISHGVIRSLYNVLKWYDRNRGSGCASQVVEYYGMWKGLHALTVNISKEAWDEVSKKAGDMGIQLQSEEDKWLLLFSLETYLHLLIRTLALSKLGRSQQNLDDLEGEIRSMGGVFAPSLFEWIFLAHRDSVLPPDLRRDLQGNLGLLLGVVYELNTTMLTVDIFREIYQNILPQGLRRSLGEFYTEENIVDEVLDAAGLTKEVIEDLYNRYRCSNKPVILDPACGSGTFLVRVARRMFEGLGCKPEIARFVEETLVGVDINPFAVEMAKLNLILAIADEMWSKCNTSYIPSNVRVYWADSLTVIRGNTNVFGGTSLSVSIPVLAQEIKSIPVPMLQAVPLEDLLSLVYKAVGEGSPNKVREGLEGKVKPDDLEKVEDELEKLYDIMRVIVNKTGNSRIVEFIKNTIVVASLLGRCDYVVGNPPWVRVHRIARDVMNVLRENYDYYRYTYNPMFKKTKTPFKEQFDYSLAFVERGLKFLRDGGVLSYVITSKVLKTAYAGCMREDLIERHRVLKLVDYSLYPVPLFQGAVNYPLILSVRKGGPGGDVDVEVYNTAGEKRSFSVPQNELPLDQSDGKSPWVLAPPEVVKAFRKVMGLRLGDVYEIHRGVMTSADGIFIGRVVSCRDGVAKLRLRDGKDVDVEADLLNPLIRGRGVDPFSYGFDEYIVFTHDTANFDPLWDDLQRRVLDQIGVLKGRAEAIGGAIAYAVNVSCSDVDRRIISLRNNGFDVDSVSPCGVYRCYKITHNGREVLKINLEPMKQGCKVSIEGLRIPNKPYATAHFLSHLDTLIRRDDYRSSMPPWAIFRVFRNKFEDYRIAWQEIAKHFEACILPVKTSVSLCDHRREAIIVPNVKVYFIVEPDKIKALKLLLYLNSSLARSLIKLRAWSVRGGRYEHQSINVAHLPIPQILLQCEIWNVVEEALSSEGELNAIAKGLLDEYGDKLESELRDALGITDEEYKAIVEYGEWLNEGKVEAHGATSGRSSSVGFRSWIREAVKGCFWRHAVSIGV
ncbi:MAG: N-6 DNA methylase [Candidatus Korarchaeum sp.]